MTEALIGHTGFVGSNLLATRAFAAVFNSTNIETIMGRRFDRIVCAGVGAVKWWANQNPEADRRGIDRLINALKRVEADRFTLISTIDVYPSPAGETEDDAPRVEGHHAYGVNRLALEAFVADRFAHHHIVRLPALFGPGLKKNAIFDLMNDNRTDVIDPGAAFQWYPVARLADDLDIVEAAGISLMNLATEPTAMDAIQRRFFPGARLGPRSAAPPRYDMHTRHGAAFGVEGPYVMDEAAVLASLSDYLRRPAGGGGGGDA